MRENFQVLLMNGYNINAQTLIKLAYPLKENFRPTCSENQCKIPSKMLANLKKIKCYPVLAHHEQAGSMLEMEG